MCEKYKVLSINKKKSMAYREFKYVTYKIVIRDKTVELVNSFNYLGVTVRHQRGYDTDNNLNKYQYIRDIISIGLTIETKLEWKQN